MIIPTEDQIAERWDELSESLKDALTSTANSDLIWKTAEAEHIPGPKIYEIGRAVSHVLFGFIHPEDLVPELKDGSQLNPQSVTAIAAVINQKIFAPLQQDINHVYAPLPKPAGGPKIMQEIKRPQVTSAPVTPTTPRPAAPPGPPGPKIISETFTAIPKISGTPLASNRNVAAPAPQPPKPPSNQGWSKATPQQPVIKLGAITPAAPIPPPMKTPVSQPLSAARPATSEFDRLDMMKKNPPAVPAPPPVMLHEMSKSMAQSPEFQFRTGAGDQMANNRPAGMSLPTKPAVLELGNVPKTPPPASAPKPPVQAAPAPMENTGPRQITEITSPKQVTAPPPPAPPNQQAPQQQTGKVIVKDFLN